MSPSDELRAERLRALHRKLLGTELQERYGHLYHAAIRSDDPVLQSMIDGRVSSIDDEIPAVLRREFFQPPDEPTSSWLWDIKSACRYDGSSDDPELQKLLEKDSLTPRSIIDFVRDRRGQGGITSELSYELSNAIWKLVQNDDYGRLSGFGLRRDCATTDISINGSRWSGRIFCDDDYVSDNTDYLEMQLDGLGQVVRGEVFTINNEVAGPQWDISLAFKWIEFGYALLPQPIEIIKGIQSVMLPWNLAEASARAVEVLIGKPGWRFDSATRAKAAVQFTPAELRDRLGDIDSNTLLKYARLAEVNTPSRGERGHRYDNSDAGAICNAIIRSTATTGLRQAAKDLLKELTGESSD